MKSRSYLSPLHTGSVAVRHGFLLKACVLVATAVITVQCKQILRERPTRIALIDKEHSAQTNLPQEDLVARMDSRYVIRITDDEILESIAQGRHPQILYFRETVFNHATAGLSSQELLEALRKRSETTSILDIRGELQDLHEQVIRHLLETVSLNSNFQKDGFAYCNRILNRMAFLIGSDRFEGAPIAILKALQEGEYKNLWADRMVCRAGPERLRRSG